MQFTTDSSKEGPGTETSEPSSDVDWWDPRRPSEGVWIRGRVGHLQLWLMRRGSEWLVHADWTGERAATAVWEELSSAPDMEAPSRFLFRNAADGLELRPALADRPIIARPRSEVTIPGGNDTTVYIGTPIWVQLREENDSDLLAEFPAERLSLSWFGRNTMDGEVCYATKTSARLDLENLPQLADFALTQVRIRNRTLHPLRFTHIKLPVRSLSIYRAGDGHFVTESVVLEQKDDSLASIEVADLTGASSTWTPAGDRREPLASGSLIKALDRFF